MGNFEKKKQPTNYTKWRFLFQKSGRARLKLMMKLKTSSEQFCNFNVKVKKIQKSILFYKKTDMFIFLVYIFVVMAEKKNHRDHSINNYQIQ